MIVDQANAFMLLPRLRAILAASAAALLAGACSAGGALDGIETALQTKTPDQYGAEDRKSEPADQAPKTEMQKAIAYWGEQYKKQPFDLKTALSYARNLKANGQKQEAFAILQAASQLHGDSTELASEYGRLALDLGQVQVAEKLLAMADDPSKPDWRVISARGTAQAKQGNYADAVAFYQRALALSPNQPSVLNNLALAYAADGQAPQAETVLRQIADKSTDPKVKQNLTLVMDLQGKHEEAKLIAATYLPAETAQSNSDYMRRLVKSGPPAPAPAIQSAETRTQPARPAAGGPVLMEASAPASAQAPARTIKASNVKTPAKSPTEPASGLRPTGDINAVPATTGAWATTVSR